MAVQRTPIDLHWEDLAMVVVEEEFTGYVMDTYCKDFGGKKKEAFEQRFREIWWNSQRQKAFAEGEKKNDERTEEKTPAGKAN